VSYFDHAFEARIVPHDVGRYCYTVVFLEPAVAAELPFGDQPRLRFSGEIGDVPFAGAWQPLRGRWYAMLSKEVLREGGFAVGDLVEVRFRVEDPDVVEVPDALVRALARDPQARAVFEGLSAGRRRGLSHHVRAAKTEPTERRRVAEVLAALAGAPWGPRREVLVSHDTAKVSSKE
jgi:hypothetical protein